MKFFISIGACLFIISVCLNVYTFTRPKISTQAQLAAEYPLLSPRIFAERQNDILLNFLPLRNQLRKLIATYENTFFMYFEYLPSGTSIGVNEKVEFKAASLMKVPIVMAYYRGQERVGYRLDSKMTIREEDIDKNFGDLWKRGVGATLTAEEAVRLALAKSDNTAAIMLDHYVLLDDFKAIYEGLDIDYVLENKQTIITAKQYTSILKSLYYSSGLSKAHSYYILDVLTKTDFTDKLPAGVPKDVKVAHKVGILDDNLYQDCGIVYVPNRPYALCMISKSTNEVANERMKTVSAMIYEFVANEAK